MLALAAVLPIARAEPVTPVEIEALTWTELRDRVAAGATTVLVPIGGTEQSGPHMALGKHNARARRLAERIARELGNALVAPVIAYVPEGAVSPPAAHMRWPGTLSVPTAAFESVLESTALSLAHAGFRDVFFLADHGDSQASVRRVAGQLNGARPGHAWHAFALDAYYAASSSGFAAYLRQRGFDDAQIGRHAGLADTSLLLAVDATMVRREAQAAGPVTGDGINGDPRRATAELGRAGLEQIVVASVAAIRERTGHPPPAKATQGKDPTR